MKPNIVRDFNNRVSDKHRPDQMLFYYQGLRNNVQWYKKIGFHFMKMFMHNSFYLFKQSKMNLIDFRSDVIKSLLDFDKMYHMERKPRVIFQNAYQHWKRKKTTLRCKFFYKNSQHHETRYRCP